MSLDKYNQNIIANLGIGNNGMKRIASGDLAVGNFFCIKAMTDIVFHADTRCSKGDTPIAGDTVLQGDVLFLPFTQVRLIEGTAYLYEA